MSQPATTPLAPEFTSILACPWDYTDLCFREGVLTCERNHDFAFEMGIPIFTNAVRREPVPRNMPPCRHPNPGSSIEPFVNDWLVNTNGNLYWGARGNLQRYPIPRGPFEDGRGRLLVDIGCGWGRWSVAAARAGFHVVGVDVHIDALSAAYRVSRQLGYDNDYLCASVDDLPFRSASIDVLFSYSVLQHLDRDRVVRFLREAVRVLKPGGTCLFQFPNSSGLYNFLLQAKRLFRDARPGTFEMRYWSRSRIRDAISKAGLRDLKISADGFFSQNPQISDLDLISKAGKLIVLFSNSACKMARAFPLLVHLADSVWVEVRAPSI